MITRDQAQPGERVSWRGGARQGEIFRLSSVNGVVWVQGDNDSTPHVHNIKDLDLINPQGEPESMADALDSTRAALAHRLELYDEDATVPVKAQDLQILLEGLNAATAPSRNVSPQGLAFERDQAVWRLREATLALAAVRQLAESWRFIPGPNRPTDEEATEDRVAQLLIQVLGNP